MVLDMSTVPTVLTSIHVLGARKRKAGTPRHHMWRLYNTNKFLKFH